MNIELKPWQTGLILVGSLAATGTVLFNLTRQPANPVLPENIPAGINAASRTPEPDELGAHIPKTP